MDCEASCGPQLFSLSGVRVLQQLIPQKCSTNKIDSMRSQSQIDFITKRFPEYEDKVTGIVVPLMDAPGAYDEAVKDVDGIIHCASLATWKFEYPSELIEPAIKSSVGILTSAAQFGKNVKRVIYTSSAAAIVGPGRKDIVYDEVSDDTCSCF